MVDPPPLLRPVPGPVSARFAYAPAAPFRRGSRRVVRLSTWPGDPVRAPCRGRVTHAGPVPRGGAVTLRCGAWSVTLTGVERPQTARGRDAAVGTTVARATGTTVGLGVRRAADRFGYVDPLPLLHPDLPARRYVPVGPAPRARPTGAARAPARPRRVPVPGSVPEPVPGAVPAPVGAPGATVPPARAARPVAAPGPGTPVLAWLGLALAALGVPGGAATVRVRRRRARGSVPARAGGR